MRGILTTVALLGLLCAGAAATEYNSGRPNPPSVTKYGATDLPQNVLFYSEMDQDVNVYQETLTHWGVPYTFTSSGPAFAGFLGSPGWTHIISNHSNTFSTGVWEAPLAAYMAANPNTILIVSDWREHSLPAYVATLGFGYTHLINYSSMTQGPGSFFAGNPSPVGFHNPGWGRWTVETSGGTTEATSAFGGGAIQRSAIYPNTFMFGPVGDTWDDPFGDGYEYVWDVLSIPEPASVTLLALAGLALLRRR